MNSPAILFRKISTGGLSPKERRSRIREVQSALLAEALQSPVPAIATGPFGKPYLPSLPRFHFNFTDSGDYVLLAFGDREVGVDLQKILPTRYDVLRIAARFYTAEETAFLSSLTDPETARLDFFRYWTIKEAWLKYLGIGLSGGMNRYDILWTIPDESGNVPTGIRSRWGQKNPPAALGRGRIVSDAYPSAFFIELTPPEEGYCLSLVESAPEDQ